MRTTICIDDHLLRQLREKAASSSKPFKQILNDTLRAGLAESSSAPRVAYHCPSFSIGGLKPGIDLRQALALADALEDEALAEKLRQGR